MAPKNANVQAEKPVDEPEVPAEDGKATAEEISNAVQRAISGDNTALWDILKRTDPKVTKPFQRAGGFRGTQIDPTWRLKMMTEVFGPVGFGWGWEQVEWTVQERMIFICVRVWFSDPKDRSAKFFTGPQWGGTELVRKNRDGTERPDDESFKMSMTDAIGKCFVQLGLAADIHMGQFDDSKYREESEAFYKAKEQGWNDISIKRFERTTRDDLADVSDLEELNELWTSGTGSKIAEIGQINKLAKGRLIEAFGKKKAELLAKAEYKGDPEPPEDQSETDADAEGQPDTEAVEDEPKDPVPSKGTVQQAVDDLKQDDKDYAKPPPPKAIPAPKNSNKQAWTAWAGMAKDKVRSAGNLRRAGKSMHDGSWLAHWLKENAESLAKLKAVDADADKDFFDTYGKVNAFMKKKDADVKAEAAEHFPTYQHSDSEQPNWQDFENTMFAYIRDTPNALIARDWWNRHKASVEFGLAKAETINSKGRTGAQAASDLKADLFKAFPQLAE